jgi:uncharacterized tellurite resistance protein B-like protein
MTIDTRSRARQWMFNILYGFKTPPNDEEMMTFAKALLTCAKADGKLAQEERDWVLGLYSARGASPESIDELERYQGTDDPVALLDKHPLTSKSRRALIYLAIRTCSADGSLHDAEWTEILRVAEKLNVDAKVAEQLRSFAEEEEQLRQKRIQLLFPSEAS